MRTAPFHIFIIDVSTRIVKHRKALQSVDFYGILICRKGAVLQVQRSCFPSWGHRCVVPLEEVQFFVALRGYECFYTWVTQGGIPLWKFGIMFSPCSPFWSLSSLARPRSLGRSPKRFFVTRTAQNTIRKNNDKKNDRPKHPKLRRSCFLTWYSRREADHCADSAFPYLYYRRQHADCQAHSALLCGIPKNFFCRPQSRLYFSRYRRLTRRFLSHSVVFRRFYVSSHISRFSVILWPFQCIFRAFWCFKNAHFRIFRVSIIFQIVQNPPNASYYPVLL